MLSVLRTRLRRLNVEGSESRACARNGAQSIRRFKPQSIDAMLQKGKGILSAADTLWIPQHHQVAQFSHCNSSISLRRLVSEGGFPPASFGDQMTDRKNDQPLGAERL